MKAPRRIVTDTVVTDERGVKERTMDGVGVGEYFMVHHWNRGYRVTHRLTGREVAWSHDRETSESIADGLYRSAIPLDVYDEHGVEAIRQAALAARWADAEAEASKAIERVRE